MFCFMIWNIQECEISKNKKSGRGQIFFHSSFILCKWMSKITKPLKWKQAAEPVESMNDGLIHAHTEMLLSFVGFLLWLKKKHENWNTTLANGGLLCTPDNSCQVLLFWTASQPASYRVCSVNDTLAADRCGSLSARVIIGICESMSLMLEDWSKGSKGAEVLPKAVNLYSILTEEKLAPSSLKTFDMTQRERRHTGTPIHETEPWLVISSTGAFPAMISQNICHEKCLLGNNGNCTL